MTLIMKIVLCLFWAASVATLHSDVTAPAKSQKSSDRSLHVRSIPAVDGISSNVYEIHMQPFAYNVYPLTASVELKSMEADEGKAVRGELMFVQHEPPTGPVLVTGNITGLAKGHHGLHVHEFGDLRKGCASAGPHFNPYMQPHGGPMDPYRHIGDLGNIVADDDGVAKVEIWDQMISLTGSHSILGRSVVIHDMKDDYGRGGDMESMKTGNAGARLACGVVGFTEQPMMMQPPMMPPQWHHHHHHPGNWDAFGPMGPGEHMGPGYMGPGYMGPGGPGGPPQPPSATPEPQSEPAPLTNS